MKTLHLAIITGIGIAVTSFSGAFFFLPSIVPGTYQNAESSGLDLSNPSTANPLGIRAQVVMEPDMITCPTKCIIPPTPHLVLTSQKGAQFIDYSVCDGTSCKSGRLEKSYYVRMDKIPPNYGGTTGLTASHIDLGSLPWQAGDTVHVIVKAFPVALYPNSVIDRDPWKTMAVDLGNSRIISSEQFLNPLGVTALVEFVPANIGLHSGPDYHFYLKLNSNSTAYLLGYYIWGEDFSARKDGMSVLLPLNNATRTTYLRVGLSENPTWHYGDTANIEVEVSPGPGNKTAYYLSLDNSEIVP